MLITLLLGLFITSSTIEGKHKLFKSVELSWKMEVQAVMVCILFCLQVNGGALGVCS